MARTRFQDPECGIAQSLGLLGDAWTLLIVRNAFFGTRRFADFQRQLGIARNILSARLRHLVDEGIFERVDEGVYGERFEYRLTAKGDALLPIMTSLREWADDWVFGEGNEPIVMCDRETGRRVPKLRVRDVMIEDLITIGLDATLQQIAQTMLERRVHRLLVIEGDELRGIVSSLDLVGLIADGSATLGQEGGPI